MILSSFGKPLGISLAVVLVFLGGVYWGANRSPSGESIATDRPEAPAEHRNRAISTEPEDFYPAAEFRQQAGLLLGCYDELNTNPQLYVDIAKAIDGRLPVFGLVHSESQAKMGRDTLLKNGLQADAMHFVPIPANTIWVRDYAPFMVRSHNNSIRMIDAKYQSRSTHELSRKNDEQMASTLSEVLRLPLRSIPLILEGGNFLSNGDGSVITSSLTLQMNREFEFSDKQIGSIMNDYFGVRTVSVVNSLEGEPTGHVDMFLTILAKNIAVVGEIDPGIDPENSRRLESVVAQVSRIATSLGPMTVFRIPMPPKWGSSWRSYTNVIMANGRLLMPSFSDVDPALEDRAEEVYRSLLPAWEIKRIPCDGLVKGGGQLHCISYNLPRYVPLDGLFEMAKAALDSGSIHSASLLPRR